MIDAARRDDLKQIEAIQIASWQSAYRGLGSEAFLGEEVPDIMARKWARLPGPGWIALVARQGDRIDGFAALEIGHEGGPHVDDLHVDPRSRGHGDGRALMAALACEVLSRGRCTMWLTVLRDNTPTRAFYLAIGGIEGAAGPDDLFGQSIISLPVVWDDPAALAALAALAAQGAGRQFLPISAWLPLDASGALA